MQKDTQDDLIKPDIHSSSKEYQGRFNGVAGRWFLDTQNDKTEKLLSSYITSSRHTNDTENKCALSIIDFGGGHAQNIDVCQNLNFTYSVLGSDESCFTLINEQLEKNNKRDNQVKNVSCLTGLLTDSGLQDNAYNIALSYRMLPHLSQWQEHIQELCRVSKESVIIEFPNSKSVNAFAEKLFALKKSVEGNTRPFTLFDITQVSGEFNKHGFELSDVKGQYLLPMVVHRAIKNKTISQCLESIAGVILARNKIGSPLICKFNSTK